MSSSSIDLSPLTSFGDALKERKNFLIGAAAIVALTIVLVIFFRNRAEEKALAPWRTLVGTSTPRAPYHPDQTAEDLASAAALIEDPDAKALALYWEALKLYDDPSGGPVQKRTALAKLQAFREEFSDSLLCTAPFPSSDPLEEAVPAADRLLVQMQQYVLASEQSSRKTENEAPPAGNTVTLVTDLGDVVITLYTNVSPESAAALALRAPTLKGLFVARVLEDNWVEVGTDVTGKPVDLDDVDADFPPYESNDLSFFEGAVAFRQAPFTEGPYNAVLRVWLQDNFRDDGRYTVLGQITSGLDILKDLSKAAQDETTAGTLAEPVEIKDVLVETPDITLPGTGAPDGDTSEVDETAAGDDGEAGNSDDEATNSGADESDDDGV